MFHQKQISNSYTNLSDAELESIKVLKDACKKNGIYYRDDDELAKYLFARYSKSPTTNSGLPVAKRLFDTALEKLKKRDRRMEKVMAIRLWIQAVTLRLR